MKLIAGLGNPGKVYRESRHNLGFRVIEEISSRHKIKLNKSKHRSLLGEGKIEEERVILVKPLTFVNLSGEALSSLKGFFPIKAQDIIVIHDDLDLARGRIRIRERGSSGGHKGVNSIIGHLGTREFIRIRIGIGRPPHPFDETTYVLGKFGKEEKGIIESAVREAAEAVEITIKEGAKKAMNRYNKIRKILSLVFSLSLAIFLSSCAYTVKTILPEHIKKISITTFKNRTFHYGLEETLTDAVVREFIVDGRLRVGRRETADALLSGEIAHYNREPLSYDNENIVEEYKIRILVDVTFRDLTTNEILWKEKDMEGEATYSVRIEPIETEQEGLERAIEELARKIVSRAIEGW